MTAESQNASRRSSSYVKSTAINTSQSDVRSVARAELNMLKRAIRNAVGRTTDNMSRYHLEDAITRIDAILDPK